MDRAPRHHVMVDFQQHQQRMWAVLEEDHEKVEKRVAELEALLREMLKAYDDGVGREDEHGNNWEFPLWQKVHAALAGQLPAAEHPFAKRLREAGPQIAAEVDRMMAATPSEDGREVPEVVAFRHQRSGDAATAETVRVMGFGLGSGGYTEPLMAIAQHSRIVAAKDAEIAEWKLRCQYNADTAHDVAVERDELRAALLKVSQDGDKLRAELQAQPARQVGGDEREAFEAAMGESVYFSPEGFQHNSGVWVYIDYTTDVAWMAWRRRASLAPTAVVMPEHRETERLSERAVLQAIAWNEAIDEVARLNRNPIPVELLKRAADQLEYHMCSGCKEETCCMPDTRDVLNELRALLGKESEI